MAELSLTVKWGKEKLHVAHRRAEGVAGLRAALLARTGVPVERQKLMNPKAWDTLDKVVTDGEQFAVCGTQRDRDDLYIAPTILDYGTNKEAFEDSAAMADEIFGPILPGAGDGHSALCTLRVMVMVYTLYCAVCRNS